jgi:hypothetical protein
MQPLAQFPAFTEGPPRDADESHAIFCMKCSSGYIADPHEIMLPDLVSSALIHKLPLRSLLHSCYISHDPKIWAFANSYHSHLIKRWFRFHLYYCQTPFVRTDVFILKDGEIPSTVA